MATAGSTPAVVLQRWLGEIDGGGSAAARPRMDNGDNTYEAGMSCQTIAIAATNAGQNMRVPNSSIHAGRHGNLIAGSSVPRER